MDFRGDESQGNNIFNVQLFVVNGKPLKFWLDGFEQRDFFGIVKIIEAFGGKLSDPRAPDTTVFANSNHLTDQSHDRYDIKFIYDSIRAQRLANLENYRIATSANQRPRCPQVEREPGSVQGAVYKIRNNDKLDNEKYKTIDSPASESSWRGEFECKAKKEMKLKDCSVRLIKIDRRNGVTLSTESSHYAQVQNNKEYSHELVNKNDNILTNGVSPQNESEGSEHKDFSTSTLAVSTSPVCTFKTISKDVENTVPKEENTNATKKDRKSIILPQAYGIQKPQPWLKVFKIPRKENEHPQKSILKKEVANERIQMKEDKIVSADSKPTPTIPPSSNECKNKVTPAIDDNNNDDAHSTTSEESDFSVSGLSIESYATRQLRDLENYLIASSSSQSGDNSTDVLKKGNSRDETSNWSKGTPSDYSKPSGKEELTGRSVDSTTRSESPHSVHPTGHNSDTKYLNSKNLNRIRWSEDEYQVMMDFLVSKNRIDRALSIDIWEECLKNNSILQKSRRTPKTLYYRFATFLRYNYTKYIKDPKVLKQFKELEIDRRMSPTKARKKFAHPPKTKRKLERGLLEITPWTEDEHYLMIHFLVKSWSIDYASSVETWESCLQNFPLLLRNGRSAVDLYKRYRDVLRHEYARYTEDSRALEKFKASESTQYFMTDCDLFAQQQIQFGRKKRRQ